MKAFIFLFILFGAVNPLSSKAQGSLQDIYSHHWYGSAPSYTNDALRSYKIIIHHAFTFRFNAKTNLADWVAYELNPHLTWGFLKEQRSWQADPLLKTQEGLNKKDYVGANRYGYERGHLAPLGSFKGSSSSYELQYLSNIAPQKKELNRGPWKSLEHTIRSTVLKGKELKILTGPLYASAEDILKPYKQPPAPWNVERLKHVPSGFWKIISYVEKNKLKVCSMIMPQKKSSQSSLKKYTVKLKDIQKYTGLVIFQNIKFKIVETCSFLIKKK